MIYPGCSSLKNVFTAAALSAPRREKEEVAILQHGEPGFVESGGHELGVHQGHERIIVRRRE